MRYFALIGLLLLGACVTDGDAYNNAGPVQQASVPQNYGYVRAGGKTNPERVRLALVQCQGEAAATPSGFWLEGGGLVGLAGSLAVRAAQEDSFTQACMARHGYVVAQPRAQ